MCLLALANVASAATPSGQDQYLETAPSGGGEESGDGTDQNDTYLAGVDANGDGAVSEEEVEAAAKKKKKAAKKAGSEEGPSGASGAVAGSTNTPTPPAAESVATSAKFGPLDRSTALIIGALALVGGLGFAVFGGGAGTILSGGGAAGSAATPPGQTPR